MFANKKSVSMKVVVLLLAVVLLFGCAAGGTLAWLAAKTTPVTNTFTTSDITIDLKETKNDFKMVPGTDIAKDPKASVAEGSEDCYLFVKVEAENTEGYITYTIADGWTAVSGVSGVYYRTVGADDDTREFSVLAGDKVHVPDTVTKAMMETAKTAAPKLTFTAYAVQESGFADAEAAWTEAAKLG